MGIAAESHLSATKLKQKVQLQRSWHCPGFGVALVQHTSMYLVAIDLLDSCVSYAASMLRLHAVPHLACDELFSMRHIAKVIAAPLLHSAVKLQQKVQLQRSWHCQAFGSACVQFTCCASVALDMLDSFVSDGASLFHLQAFSHPVQDALFSSCHTAMFIAARHSRSISRPSCSDHGTVRFLLSARAVHLYAFVATEFFDSLCVLCR
jgi:hypothetical protein